VEDWTALVAAGGVGEGDGEGTAFAASTFVPDVRAAGGMGNADGVCAPAGIVAAAVQSGGKDEGQGTTGIRSHESRRE
jgi:hypothetical protein